MAPPKGFRPPAAGMGRKKGSPNRFTGTLREAILASFDRVGGIDYLERQARENPTAYMMLLKTVLPMQITGPNNGPIMVITGVARAGDDEELISQNAPAVIEHEQIDTEQSRIPARYPPAETRENQDQDAGRGATDDPPEMRAVAMTRNGPRFREAPPPAQPTHEGRTITTASGLKIRSVQSVDD
jgi:hypothetical protein